MLGRNHTLTTIAGTLLLSVGAEKLCQYQPEIGGRLLNVVTPDERGMFALGLLVLGAILPDIDSPNSMVVKRLGIYLPFKHRTWTHALYIPLLLVLISIAVPIVRFLTIGYLFHLWEDSFSRSGIDWLYPKKNKKHIALYKTNTISEYITAYGFIAVCAVVVYIAINKGYSAPLLWLKHIV